MNSKFIFDIRKCVACRACRVACNIRNEWEVDARNIYICNPEAAPGLPVVSISMACNHCKNPVCLDSCPSEAISRDDATGAIILDSSKCFGCKYCSWNCPFDAPKYDRTGRKMEKCNLCYINVKENRMPACVNACPTGALKYESSSGEDLPGWMHNNLVPSVVLNGLHTKPAEIIPDRNNNKLKDAYPSKRIEWSLLLFTFLSAVSVTLSINAFLTGTHHPVIPVVMIILAGLFSLFHLGRPIMAWRSIINIRKSELSREIATYLVYTMSCIVSYMLPSEVTLLISCLTGLLLLIVIDRVYMKVNDQVSIHSGQVLFIALTAIPFFSLSLLPLLFVSVLRFILSLKMMKKNETGGYVFMFRFIRLTFLVISVGGILSGIADEIALPILFIAGEIIDRVLYYNDFNTPFFINGINFENQAE